MGMFKDINKMKKQGQDIQKAQGKRTGMIGMLRDTPGNISRASSAVDDAMALQADIQKQQALLTTGTQGKAKIKNFSDTGTLVNFNPQVVLDLEVTCPGQAAYAAQLTTAVPQVYLGQLQQGASVGVRVDPSDPSLIAIDWAAAAG
jgi:hypothetical protein